MLKTRFSLIESQTKKVVVVVAVVAVLLVFCVAVVDVVVIVGHRNLTLKFSQNRVSYN